MSHNGRIWAAASIASCLVVVAPALVALGFYFGQARADRSARQFSMIAARLDAMSDRIASLSNRASDPFFSACSTSELRRAVHEELAAVPGPPGAVGDDEQEHGEAEEPKTSPTDDGAFENGLALVEGEVAEGRWTEQDARQLGQLFAQMMPAQRGEVLDKLLPSINSGIVKLSTHGSPY